MSKTAQLNIPKSAAERIKPTHGIECPYCAGTGRLADVSVGALILARRKSLNLTQEQLAERVHISRTQIANIEIGRSDIPVKTLAKFAAALECSMKDLVP